MFLDDLKRMDTAGHIVRNYTDEDNILYGRILFDDTYDINKFCEYISYYMYVAMRPLFDGQKKYSNRTYDIFFRLLYEEFNVLNVVQPEDASGKFVIEYEIDMSGISNLNKVVRYFREDIASKARETTMSQEEREAENIVFDILKVFETVFRHIEANSRNKYIDRLEEMVKRGM